MEIIKGVLPNINIKLSLSETKSAHIDGAIRPGLAAAECGPRSGWHAIPAHPCSMIGAFELDCSSLHKSEADALNAAHQIQQCDQGSPVGSS